MSATAPLRPVGLGELHIGVERRADGSLLLRSMDPVRATPPAISQKLLHWAHAAPERTFLAERGPNGQWVTISYGETLARVERIAAALLARELTPERPIMILSGNSIRHALLALAAMHIGVPYAPISTAYALVSTDFAKLRHIANALTPGLVFADSFPPFARAITATMPPGVEIVAAIGSGPGVTPFSSLEHGASSTAAVDAAHAKVNPDTIAKVLFTSGSTGQPKGVINTQRMLCLNQAMLETWAPFHAHEPPVLLDWLPWNHTFGGNHNFGLVLWNGGTLWIDDGRPTLDGMFATVRNLKEISPTLYFNVPKGYQELLPFLRADPALRTRYLERLRVNFYSGASLSPHIAAGLDEIAVAATGQRILMVTGYGSTETAPAALVPTEAIADLGVIGLPLPGITLKLSPTNGKIEARIQGGTVTPGYWRDPQATAAAFDAEGFYCLGDALRFHDVANPARGLVFDGRIAEDFKLASGTWVSAGPLRLKYLAGLSPLARELVIAGHDRDVLAALVIPDLASCRALLPDGGRSLAVPDILAHPTVRGFMARALTSLADTATGSSTRIDRLILLVEPPSIDAGEITDKGSINQRAMLERRAGLVAELYADPPPPQVILPAR